jgi:phosphoadenosine phosphosulfate reductase
MSLETAEKDLVAQGAALVAEEGDDVLAQARISLRWAHQTFGDKLVVASSMGDEVLVHLAAEDAPGVDVLFLDTGYHFPETLAVRDLISEKYEVQVRTVLPLLTVQEQTEKFGPELWAHNPDSCCAIRKVEPLERGLQPYTAWVTGMRRVDALTRTDIEVVGWDARRGKVKLNPLASWTDEEVQKYIKENGVIQHPLRAVGYASIGCAPCTRAVAPGEDARAGRWSGTTKTECGLHL